MVASDELKPVKNKRRTLSVLALVIVAVLGAVTYVLLQRTPLEEDAHEVVAPELEKVPTEDSSDVAVASRLADVDVTDANGTGTITWTVASEQDVDSSSVPAYKEVVEGRVLLQISDDLPSLEQFDVIDIYIPQLDETYQTTIDEVKISLGSNRVYKGHMFSGDNPYFYVLTVGSKNVFGHFETPQGSYELFGNRTLAWLMPSVNMDKNIDYSRPDYIVPDLDPIPDNLKSRYPTKPKE